MGLKGLFAPANRFDDGEALAVIKQLREELKELRQQNEALLGNVGNSTQSKASSFTRWLPSVSSTVWGYVVAALTMFGPDRHHGDGSVCSETL